MPLLIPWFRRIGLLAVQAVLIGILTLALLEAIVLVSFRYPGVSPIPAPMLRQLHILFARNTIQAMPECARFDDTLTYTLRPGECTFANPEYRTRYQINSLGVRDTEAKLERPEVVVLGDSIAMGWGVEQDEAFPQVFERLTGLRTLNAAVSSYGTARELLMFDRVNREAVGHVVIQYHDNDLPENEAFAGGEWRTLTRDEYERTVQQHARTLRYHPAKYSLNILVLVRNAIRERGSGGGVPAASAASRDHEAAVFLRVLEKSSVDLEPFTVWVLSLDSGFIEAAGRLAAESPSPVLSGLRFLDAGFVAGLPGSFYVLDDHPTAAGHEAIARMLAEAVTGEE